MYRIIVCTFLKWLRNSAMPNQSQNVANKTLHCTPRACALEVRRTSHGAEVWLSEERKYLPGIANSAWNRSAVIISSYKITQFQCFRARWQEKRKIITHLFLSFLPCSVASRSRLLLISLLVIIVLLFDFKSLQEPTHIRDITLPDFQITFFVNYIVCQSSTIASLTTSRRAARRPGTKWSVPKNTWAPPSNESTPTHDS